MDLAANASAGCEGVEMSALSPRPGKQAAPVAKEQTLELDAKQLEGTEEIESVITSPDRHSRRVSFGV